MAIVIDDRVVLYIIEWVSQTVMTAILLRWLKPRAAKGDMEFIQSHVMARMVGTVTGLRSFAKDRRLSKPRGSVSSTSYN